MFYTFDVTNTKCYLAEQTNGTDAIAFKSALGMYTVWNWNATVSSASVVVGVTIGSPTAINNNNHGGNGLLQCTQLCDLKDECVAVVYDNAQCTLKQATQSVDFKKCGYRAVGAKMRAAS